MDRFFNMDNKFFSVMSRVADLIILNILCLLCCIPVVTIGPSLTALFYVTLKMVRNEESYIARGFFKSFKQNLRQGIVINLIMLAVAGILYLDFRFVSTSSSIYARVMFILLMVALIFYLMVFLYIYPILAKFENSIRNTFTNSLLMSIRHLPYTLLMALITAVPFIVFFFSPSGEIQGLVLLIGFMAGISLLAFINSFFFVRIFDNYIPKKEEADESESGSRLAAILQENDPGQAAIVQENGSGQEAAVHENDPEQAPAETENSPEGV